MKALIMAVAVVAVSTATVTLATPPSDYQRGTGAQKQKYLWDERILATEYRQLPEVQGLGWVGILKSLKIMTTLNLSFDHASDEMPEGRKKLLHPYGTTALVEFIPARESGFTGVYANNALGLARLSLAAPPSQVGYTPGMALKFFVDGKPSVNLHVMNNLGGQGEDQNFFKYPFTNSIPEPDTFVLKALKRWFALFADPLRRSVDHLAKVNPNGSSVALPSSPYDLHFVPTNEAQIDPSTRHDFRDELARLPNGTVLYDIWGTRSAESGNIVRVGKLVLRSRFVASEFGDYQLFFQHSY